MKLGIVSVTFRTLSVDELIDVCKNVEIESIEWGGDVHVPPNNIENAKLVCEKSKQAGISIASYGSYYRIGEDMDFQPILETAIALDTNNIRVWAGTKNAEDADDTYYEKCVKDAQNICDMASMHEIDVSFEYHGGTLTNTLQSTVKLLELIDKENVFTYWQPLVVGDQRASRACHVDDIKTLMDLKKLKNVHIYHWVDDKRKLLSEGREFILAYSKFLDCDNLLVEFVKDDEINNFIDDVKTLREIF